MRQANNYFIKLRGAGRYAITSFCAMPLVSEWKGMGMYELNDGVLNRARSKS